MKRQIFVSYAWESDYLVDEIQLSLKGRGLEVRRDKDHLAYGESIADFTKKFGAAKAIILVISDAYFESEWCMSELIQIEQHGDFIKRTFPILLPSAELDDIKKRIDRLRYWENRQLDLEEELQKLQSRRHTSDLNRLIDLYDRIRAKFDSLFALLRDRNAFSLKIHRETDFAELAKAITKELALSGNPVLQQIFSRNRHTGSETNSSSAPPSYQTEDATRATLSEAASLDLRKAFVLALEKGDARLQEELFAQMKAIEEKSSGPQTEQTKRFEIRAKDRDFERHFPMIDFAQAFGFARKVIQRLKTGGAAAFLIPKSELRGGRWFAERIRREFEPTVSNFLPPCHVNLEHASQLDFLGFLQKLGKGIGLNPLGLSDETEAYCNEVLQHLSSKLLGGSSALMIQIDGCERIEPRHDFLPWFIEDIWRPLVQQLSEIPGLKKLIILLFTDIELWESRTLSTELFCPAGEFEPNKIALLSLEDQWEYDEIHTWLSSYSTLFSGLDDPSNVEMLSQDVVSSTNGIPQLVYDVFQRRLASRREP